MKDQKIPSNPRMHNPDVPYAHTARGEDYVSLRDHFAGVALNSLIAHVNMEGYEWAARKAYHYADAMLKVREEILNKKS